MDVLEREELAAYRRMMSQETMGDLLGAELRDRFADLAEMEFNYLMHAAGQTLGAVIDKTGSIK
jgi:hypothetical protein